MTNCNTREQEQTQGQQKPTKLAVVPEGGLWTVDQVATHLQVSKSWVWKQCREKQGFPFVELGRRNYRFDPAKVMAWVEDQSNQQQGRAR